MRRGNSIKGSELLRRFEVLQGRMDDVKAKYEQCKGGAYPTVVMDRERVQTSQSGSKVEALAMDLYEIRGEYADVWCDYIDVKLKLFDRINKISNPKYAEVILHRYIEHKTDVETAAIMKVSKATQTKWLLEAIEELDKVSGRRK